FAKSATKAEILAREQSTSHRVARVFAGTLAVAAATFLVGFGSDKVSADPWRGWIAAAGVVLLINVALQGVLRAYHPRVRRSVKRFNRLLILMTLFLLVAKVMLPHLVHEGSAGISPYLVPLPVLAITLALVYSGPVAICASAATAAIVGMMYEYTPDGDVSDCIVLAAALFIGSLVAVAGVSKIRNRTRLVVVGTACGAVQFASIAFLELWVRGVPDFESMDVVLTFLSGPGWGFLNGLCSGILVTSALPFIERIFDVTTDIRLIELADQNHPLLRQFSLLAPGSFMHSLMVGQLAEEAAQSIGANDLLARVGAYYHDIGKMLKPNYFVENTGDGDNAHDRLSPGMSRLIIISHVKDGIRIAEEEGLPRPIIDMIPMHHGTSVVEYFFHKKRQQEEEQGIDEESGQEAFQYPGPKPTFREAGILMLADTTEAISRVLSDPTPTRLRQVVRDVIHKKMVTEQLDECELTMRDLKGIEDAFVRVLASIHHGRIRYPGDETNGDDKKPKKGNVEAAAEKSADAAPRAATPRPQRAEKKSKASATATATAEAPDERVTITDQQQSLSIDEEQVESLVIHALEQEKGTGRVEVVFVDDATIADLHQKFLGVEGATDVITFPATTAGETNGEPPESDGLLGEVVVSTDTAVRQAPEFSGDPMHESYLYVVHGVLHLLGYDDRDPAARKKMEARQVQLLEDWKKQRNGRA
ncbi:MAG: rRNA maturation RNase YbeY, partial [Planctomycetota bacterium]